MKNSHLILSAFALLLLAPLAHAEINWYWWFSPSECGYMQTDGELIGDQAPAGRYTTDVTQLRVHASTIKGCIAATYTESQPVQGFDWDGSQVTLFWRGSGQYSNGLTYFRDDWLFGYGFSTNWVELRDSSYNVEAEGPLYWTPVPPATNIEIVALSDGKLTWTGEVANTPYRIEWASDLASGFTNDWDRFGVIAATGTTTTASVPMYYRVVPSLPVFVP